MNTNWVHWLRLVILSAVVGILIRFLAWLWNRLWEIRIGGREGGALAGATLALLIIAGLVDSPSIGAFVGGLVIVGYFLVKLTGEWFT